MHANQRTGLNVMIEFMMAPPEEKDRQIKQFKTAVLGIMRSTDELLKKIAARMPDRKTAPSFDKEAMRKTILADPLNRKNRRHSLSG